MAQTDLMVMNSIFRDNKTYLSASNWGTYFKNALKNGFLGYNPAFLYHTQSGDVIRFNFQRALLQGQLIYHYNDISDIPVVTEEEGDQFIFYYWDGDKVTLAKTSMAGDNASSQVYLLANLLKYNYGSGYNTSALPYTMDYFLPICYGVYNNGNPIYWNLSKMLRPDGEPMTEHVEISGSGTIENIKYGAVSQYGLVQIYGGQNYSIKIANDYTQNRVLLYPIPCINQQASAIYIVNETANSISVKIPTNYNRMTFDYVHSGDWITETDYISYSILPNVPVTINIAQIAQAPDYVGSGQDNVPISYYEVTQNIKNNDSGEGYTKAEANAIFATKTEISDKVDATDLGDLAYKDTSELGDLAVKDSVDYETDIENLPAFGTMAETDDAPSDGKIYGRQDADWSEIMTSSDIENALKTKANSSSVADEYDTSVEYTLGDVIIKDGQLYKDVEEWTNLNVKQIQQNTAFSVGDYGYYGDPLTLKFYRALEDFTPTAFVSDYVISQYVSNGTIIEIQPLEYAIGETYAIDQIVKYKVVGMYPDLYKLTSTYGKFEPVTVEDIFYTKEETDEALSHKLDELTMDDVPESGSDNPVKSGGIYNALAEKTDTAVIAEDYDPEAEYAIGDLFIKDGQLSRYAYEKTQIITTALTAQGHAVSDDYITYEDDLFHVAREVLWNEQTVSLAYDYVLANTQIFEPVEYELYDSQKEYEADTVVKIGGNYYKTLAAMAIETVNVEDVISEKLSIISFLNALDNVDAELDNVNELVATKANTSDMNSALALKADISYVESALDFITDPKIPTFYVNGDSGSDSTGDGTESAPFKTISKAIDKIPNGGCANIVVLPYIYEETVSVTGKKIKITGTVNSTITISAPQGIQKGITVNNGGLVVLTGDFRVTGNSGAITVSDNSSLIYDKRGAQDTLTLRATTTTATSDVIMVLDGSSFIVHENPNYGNVEYLDISAADNNFANTAIWVANGSFVSVPKVTIDINTIGHGSRGVYALGSIVTINNLSGDYEVPVINNRSFVHIPDISYPVSSNEASLLAPKYSPVFTGTPTAPTPSSTDNSAKIATTEFVNTAISSKASLASPAFTGNPTAPTQTTGDNSTKIATTAFVKGALDNSGLAPLDSPTFTGIPTAPIPVTGDYSTQIATTAFVNSTISSAITSKAPLESPSFTGTPTAPTQTAGDNSTKIATTAFVKNAVDSKTTVATPSAGDNSTKIATTAFVKNALTGYATLASPALTGEPTATTPTYPNYSQRIATTAYVSQATASGAPVNSPAFTGTPTAPTPNADNNSTRIATTEFVKGAISGKANLASPVFTGTPSAPTPSSGDNSTKIATTAFVKSAISATDNPMTNIYVSDSGGSDSTGDGTQMNPYKTIQKAIDVASPNKLTTVNVVPGYYAQFVVNGKQIEIVGTSNTLISISIDNMHSGSVIQVINNGVLTLRGNIAISGTIYGIRVERARFNYVARDNTDILDINCTGRDGGSDDGYGIYASQGSIVTASSNSHTKITVYGQRNCVRIYQSTVYLGKITVKSSGVSLTPYLLQSLYSTFCCGVMADETGGDYGGQIKVKITNSQALLNGTMKYNFNGDL